MPAATNSFQADIINYFFRNQSVTQPSNIYAALSSTVPLADGSNWTEITGGGYARTIITLGAPSLGVSSNTSSVTFGPATGADWATVLAVGVYYVPSAGTLKLFKAVSAKTAVVGTSITWAAGDLVFTVV
jgi:hypothetical protein